MARSAYDLDTPRDHHWSTQAACRTNPDWWTVASRADSPGRRANARARAICRTCPVLADCTKLLHTDDAPPGTIIAGVEIPWTSQGLYRRTQQTTLTCKRCSTRFTAVNNRQIYCNRRCQFAAYRAARRAA